MTMVKLKILAGPSCRPRDQSTHQFGSHNLGYVNPFMRGFTPPAGFRYSATVGPGFEIAIFVAKLDAAARNVDRISSL